MKRNGHAVTRLFSGLEDWDIHPLAGPLRRRWKMARRNARLRTRRCNLTLEQLMRRTDVPELERAAIGLYRWHFDRIRMRVESRQRRDLWLAYTAGT